MPDYTEKSAITTIKGVVLVAVGASSYGVLATFVKMANLRGVHTGILTFSQYVIGALALWVVCVIRNQPRQSGVHQTSYPRLKLMGYGLSLGLTSTFYYISVQYIPVSIAVILLMQAIWMGIVLEAVRERRMVEPSKIIGGLVVILGTLMATDVFGVSWQLNAIGVLFGLLAAVSYTVTMYASNHVALQLPSLSRSKYMVSGGLIAVIAYWNLSILHHFSWHVLAAWGIFLAIFGTILPPILFTRGFPITGTALGSIVSAMEIPVSVIAALIFLDEKVDAVQWIGIALILLAVVVINARIKTLWREQEAAA